MSPNAGATRRANPVMAQEAEPQGTGSVSFEVRDCRTQEEYEACVRLQAETWGPSYRDVVTPSLLKVSREVGGVVAGAFLGTGEMAGFVFGLTGVRAGRLVHWSHMLAVDREYRDRGVGRCLKRFQWSVLRGLGVEAAYWTFDPLVARNAHLNLNRLAVRLESYVPDMYADTGSGLHAFGTDRFVVSWPIGGAAEPGGREPAAVSGPAVNVDGRGVPLGEPREADAASIRIAIPLEIEPLLARGPEGLRRWRASTRSAFQRYLGRGYRVRGFCRDSEMGWYILEAGAGAS